MNELRTLVEEGRIVLVAFDHEIFRVVQPCTLSEICRESADEITGFASGLFHDPGQKGRRRGFAVRASDDEIVPAAQKIIFQNLRQREIK